MSAANDVFLEAKRTITYRIRVPHHPIPAAFVIRPGELNRMPRVVWDHLHAQQDSAGIAPIKRHLEAGWLRDMGPRQALEKLEGREPIARTEPLTPLQAAAETYAQAKDEAAPELDKDASVELAAVVEAKAQERAREVAKTVPQPEPSSEPKRKRKHGVAGDADTFLPLSAGIDHGEG
jgi:hypothetical protein